MKFLRLKKAGNVGYKLTDYQFEVFEKTFPNNYVFQSHSAFDAEELNRIYDNERDILDFVEKRYNLTNIEWNKETFSDNKSVVLYWSVFDAVPKHRKDAFGYDYLKTDDTRLPKHNFNPTGETLRAKLRVFIKSVGKEIQSTIQQPNKPKPTTTLPDNMEWSWDPNAADWVAVMKNNMNVTPPLYNPQNQNVVNQTTNYMSAIKSSTKIVKADWGDDEFDYAYYLNKFEKIIYPIVKQTSLPIKVGQGGKSIFIQISNKEIADKGKKQEFEQIINQILEQIRQYKPHFITFGISGDTTGIGITSAEDNEGIGFYNEKPFKIDSYDKKQSSCLSQFLDGPRYSKEIKIEAGLIKDGLVKYAGFDFNKGTKYAITTKGLEVLRKAFEAEHNEALNEREKLAYLFGFNTDEVSTLDTTGKVIKSDETLDEQLEESWNKYYPLYLEDIKTEKITEENYPADDEVAQNLKLMLKGHLQSIQRYKRAIPLMKRHTENKMKKIIELGHSKGLSEDEITKQIDQAAEEYYKKENKIKPIFDSISEDYIKEFIFNYIKNKKSASLNKFAKKFTIYEADGTELGKVTASSELDAKVKFGIEHPEYADSQSICAKEVKSQYEQTTEQHLDYPNPSETPHTDVIIENHDGWVNTADQKRRPYTEEEKRLLPLFRLLNEYVARKEITLEETPDNQPGTVATGQAEVINDLEHKVKDLGFHCEPIAEITDNDYIGADIYSLKIFYK